MPLRTTSSTTLSRSTSSSIGWVEHLRGMMTTTPHHQLNLDGVSILVTGGTGSFGRRFIRTVLERYKPARLIVFSRDEQKQYEMAQDRHFQNPALRFFIG